MTTRPTSDTRLGVKRKPKPKRAMISGDTLVAARAVRVRARKRQSDGRRDPTVSTVIVVVARAERRHGHCRSRRTRAFVRSDDYRRSPTVTHAHAVGRWSHVRTRSTRHVIIYAGFSFFFFFFRTRNRTVRNRLSGVGERGRRGRLGFRSRHAEVATMTTRRRDRGYGNG